MFLPSVGAVVLAVMFVIGTIFLGNLNSGGEIEMVAQSQINDLSELPVSAVEVEEEINFEDMESQVKEVLKEYDADFGIGFKDLVTNISWGIDDDKVFTAASTMKVLAVSALYDEVERGILDLDKRIGGVELREHARLALEVSDNNSWETINNAVGYKDLQKYASSLGLGDVDVFENRISARDFRILLEKLYRGQLLNNENTREILSFMDHTETENRIPAGLEDAEIIYHKTGTLDALTHDGAVVKSGNGDYILTVYTEYLDGDVDERSEVIARISNIVWDEYNLVMQN